MSSAARRRRPSRPAGVAWLAWVMLGLLAGAGPVAAQVVDTQVLIEVDAARARPLPALLRAGIFSFRPLPPAQALQAWLDETRPGLVEIDIGEPVFQLAVDEDDVLRRTRALLPMLQRIRQAGAEPLLAITRIPAWLSSRPQAAAPVAGDVVPIASIVAPRDGAAWSALVAKVVAELRSGLGRTPDLKVGWEPDQSAWQGSEAEFFAFYRDTVRGIRRADAAARVGGPSVSALYNGKGGDGAAPLLPRFLRYCADTALPELGLSRLPLDFLVWHQFGTDSVLSWQLAARQARAWLRAAGYPESTELVIGEWSSWSAWPRPASPEHDGPEAAAHIVASLAAMQDAGIGRAAYTSLLEQREVEGQAFIGSFGVFTNQFVKKPAYWAFAALAKLGDTQLAARSSDPLVGVLAGRASPQELAVLLATPRVDARALQRSFIGTALAAGLNLPQLQRALDGRQIERLAAGQLRVDELRVGEALRPALEQAWQATVPLARRAEALRGKPRQIVIELAGATTDGARVEVWRIDSRHANAQALQDRIAGHLQQRLAQEKQALAGALLQRFETLGFSAAQVEVFKQVMNARQRETALAQRPATEQPALRAMGLAAQAYVDERLWAVGSEINAWPELGFGVDGRGASLSGNRITLTLDDGAVALVRLIRQR